MKSLPVLIAAALLMPAAEVMSVDAHGRIIALFHNGETIPLTVDLHIGGQTVRSVERVEVERSASGGSWKLSLNGFELRQQVDGTRSRVEFIAESDAPATRIAYTFSLPSESDTPRVDDVKLNGSSTTLRGRNMTVTLKFDREYPIILRDRLTRTGRSLAAELEVHNGPVTKGSVISFEVSAAVEGTPDHSPANLTLDATRTRYKFHGFGGNYCFSTDSPVAQYTLKNLRQAWSRVEMNSREWEPENDNEIAAETDWQAFESRDREGTKLHRDFLLWQQIQAKKIPYIISVWRLPEWLYSDPNERPASAHRRRVPSEKWDELLEHIGSYLQYAKRKYNVEPDLFSFNEPNIGVNVIFTPDEHREALIRIGEHLQKLGLKTKVLLGDATGPQGTHEWALSAANDSEALRYAGAIAFHSWGGATPEQYGAWGRLGQWLNLPLVVAEVGVDAFAWRGRMYDTYHYGIREVEMYQQLLLHARPQALLQWEYTGDYSLARVEGREVSPTARFYFIKQFADLTPLNADALTTGSDHEKVLFTAFAGDDGGRRVYTMHVANLGASRSIALTGIPASIRTLRTVRTSETENYRELEPVRVVGGVAQLQAPERCLVTLTTE